MIRPAQYQYKPQQFNYKEWPIIDLSGGKNDFLDDNLIKGNQATDLQNVICVTIGRLQKRKGQAKLNTAALAGAIQGLYAYYYGATLQNRRIITVSNGVAYYWDGAAFQSFRTGLSTTNQVQFITGVNYMMGFDGTAPFKYDGTTASTLANAPTTGKCPVLHKESVFVITDLDTIRWSDPFKPESWPGVNVWQFDKGDGDELAMAVPFGGQYLACKKRKIHLLRGSSLDDFRSDIVDNNHGVVGQRAGIVLEPYFYYVSYDGIMLFDGIKSTNLTAETIPLTWAGVNKAQLSKAVAGYNPAYNHLWFHLPEGASTTNNLVLVFDLNFKTLWIFRGIEAAAMMQFNDGTNLKTYTGHATLGHVVEQNIGFNDLGVAITSYWQGGAFDDGDPVRVKKIKKHFAADANGLNDATFKYRLNYGAWQTPTAQTDKDNVRKYRIPNGKCRQFQPRYEHAVLDQDFTLSGAKTLFDPGRDK